MLEPTWSPVDRGNLAPARIHNMLYFLGHKDHELVQDFLHPKKIMLMEEILRPLGSFDYGKGVRDLWLCKTSAMSGSALNPQP